MSEEKKIPQCIGIILDGNRRWARERNLPTLEGHRRGYVNMEPIVKAARERGVRHIIVYAFSTENWKRTAEEVGYLMNLFETAVKEKLADMTKDNIEVRFAGQIERLPEGVQKGIAQVLANNPKNPSITLWVCLSYGGRPEIVQAAQKAAVEGEITEESLAKHLWTAGMPDPDIIVRTSGEQRISNFLLWQCAYSEFFFIKPHWPAFTPEDLDQILDEYANRQRRMGK